MCVSVCVCEYSADCISCHTNNLGKGMNPIILPPAVGK